MTPEQSEHCRLEAKKVAEKGEWPATIDSRWNGSIHFKVTKTLRCGNPGDEIIPLSTSVKSRQKHRWFLIGTWRIPGSGLYYFLRYTIATGKVKFSSCACGVINLDRLRLPTKILHWHSGVIKTLFLSSYQDGEDNLPILADALEEAECKNKDLIARCRIKDLDFIVDVLRGAIPYKEECHA